MSSKEFSCEFMCIPVHVIAAGSSVLLISAMEGGRKKTSSAQLFFSFFFIIWVTRTLFEAVQLVALGNDRKVCQFNSMADFN